MSETNWSAVDDYFNAALSAGDDALAEAERSSAAAALPAINVSPAQGKLLNLLARSAGARRILEVGTLGGYSTIWLARAIRTPGRIITCELDPHHAAVARANLDRAGVGDLAEIRVGPAAGSLRALIDEGQEPFDFVFIDADKSSNARYAEYALALSHPGTVIVVDNMVRGGRFLDSSSGSAAAVKDLTGLLASRGVDAVVTQTVGARGHDGFLLAVV